MFCILALDTSLPQILRYVCCLSVALALDGHSVQLYLLASRVSLYMLRSVSTTSNHRFVSQYEEVLKHVSKGLEMTAEDESEVCI